MVRRESGDGFRRIWYRPKAGTNLRCLEKQAGKEEYYDKRLESVR